jgi:hypothetical protein
VREKRKIKITVEYEDVLGEKKKASFELPDQRKEVVGNVLASIANFDDRDVTYGFLFLKGEPHSEIGGVFQPTAYVKVSPNLPKAEEFKKVLVKRVLDIWGEHMKLAHSGEAVAYAPTADLKKEDSIVDLTVVGKF